MESGFQAREVGDEFREDYENQLLDSKLKEAVTPIRYDYSPSQYNQGLHPASHVHFGHMSRVRIATKKALNPISFVCLVLRQCYPEYWRSLLQESAAHIWCRNVRDNLVDIDNQFWNPMDDHEMILV